MAPDLESAKVKARSLFDTLNMPQNPDGLRILDQDGGEGFFWTPPPIPWISLVIDRSMKIWRWRDQIASPQVPAFRKS